MGRIRFDTGLEARGVAELLKAGGTERLNAARIELGLTQTGPHFNAGRGHDDGRRSILDGDLDTSRKEDGRRGGLPFVDDLIDMIKRWWNSNQDSKIFHNDDK